MVSMYECVCVLCLCPFALLHVNLIIEMQRGDMAGKPEREVEGIKKERSKKRVFWCEYKKRDNPCSVVTMTTVTSVMEGCSVFVWVQHSKE